MFHQSYSASPIRAASPSGTGAASPPSSSWMKKLWTAGADKRIAEIQNISDDGTSADEILAVARDILLPLSLLFSSVFCFLFYWKYLGEAFPPIVAIIGAGIIALLIETGKVWFGIRALRFLYFGKPLDNVANTILFLSVTAFASVAFLWSFSNSTSGLHDMAQSNAFQANQSEFSVNTTDIDQQITQARQAQREAGKVKWKGTVTIDAQRTMRKQEDNITALQNQRAKLIEQATNDHADHKKFQGEQANKAASWTRLVGGVFEAVQLILLCIASSCEKILDTRNPKAARRITKPPTPFQADPSLNGQPAQGYPSNDYNATFFNRGVDGNVISRHTAAPANPVAQPVPQKFIVETYTPARDAEKLLRMHRTELQKWIGHFGRSDAPGVVQCVTERLIEAHSDIDRMGWGIDPEEVEKFCDYAENRIGQKLTEAGKPYAGLGVMLATLQGKATRTTELQTPIAETVLRSAQPVEGRIS